MPSSARRAGELHGSLLQPGQLFLGQRAVGALVDALDLAAVDAALPALSKLLEVEPE